MYKHCVCKVVVLLYKPILFSPSCCLCRHRKLRVVVIQIFCCWPWLRDVTLSSIKDDDVKMRSPGRNPDSGIREIFVCRIRNPRKFCLWNLESWVCGIPNTYQGIRNPTNDLNPDSKFLFQRLQSIYKGVEKLGKFVHKRHHSSESLAHFQYRTWISISYIHNCFNRKLGELPSSANCELPSRNKE